MVKFLKMENTWYNYFSTRCYTCFFIPLIFFGIALILKVFFWFHPEKLKIFYGQCRRMAIVCTSFLILIPGPWLSEWQCVSTAIFNYLWVQSCPHTIGTVWKCVDGIRGKLSSSGSVVRVAGVAFVLACFCFANQSWHINNEARGISSHWFRSVCKWVCLCVCVCLCFYGHDGGGWGAAVYHMTLEIKPLFALNVALSLSRGLAACVRKQKLFEGLQIGWRSGCVNPIPDGWYLLREQGSIRPL